MKKIIASISLVCYFVVTCGVVFNYHYCMNRLASTQVFAAKTKICGKCGMDMHGSKGCCHDEMKVVKLQQDQHKTAIESYDISLVVVLMTSPSDFMAASFYTINDQRHFYNHSPPLLSEQDTYLQNGVFRI